MAPALGPARSSAPAVGSQARQPSLDGTRMDDLVGGRFAVVARTAALLQGTGGDWWTAPRRAAARTPRTRPRWQPTLDALAADVVVVRPDRYVLFAGEQLAVPDPAACELLIR